MHRTSVIFAAAALAFTLGGCSGDSVNDESNTGQSASTPATKSDPPTQAVTWGYLLSTYPEVINANCDPNTSAFPDCAATLNSRLGSFEVDVMELPVGKPRANVLTGINMIRDGYEEYSDAMCPLTPSDIDCTVKAIGVSGGLNVVSTNVKREAANE
ncbi:hypothetical protein [Gordonia sp. NPDC058843]|uniref:hypothetical protein n=1 Tax=Gordonia sp. NPDC058843 TaxID=3346648 RepID=UPI0036757590